MPTTNHDSSILTKRKRSLALYTFNRNNKAAVAAGTSVRREQPDSQLGGVVTQRHEVSANTNPAGSGCPCSSAVNNNAGGNNSVNIG